MNRTKPRETWESGGVNCRSSHKREVAFEEFKPFLHSGKINGWKEAKITQIEKENHLNQTGIF